MIGIQWMSSTLPPPPPVMSGGRRRCHRSLMMFFRPKTRWFLSSCVVCVLKYSIKISKNVCVAVLDVYYNMSVQVKWSVCLYVCNLCALFSFCDFQILLIFLFLHS